MTNPRIIITQFIKSSELYRGCFFFKLLLAYCFDFQACNFTVFTLSVLITSKKTTCRLEKFFASNAWTLSNQASDSSCLADSGSVSFLLLSIVDGQLQCLIRWEIRRLPAICSICLPAYNKCRSQVGPSAVQRLICPIPLVPFKDVSSWFITQTKLSSPRCCRVMNYEQM